MINQGREDGVAPDGLVLGQLEVVDDGSDELWTVSRLEKERYIGMLRQELMGIANKFSIFNTLKLFKKNRFCV